jgi:hypothetical protein
MDLVLEQCAWSPPPRANRLSLSSLLSARVGRTCRRRFFERGRSENGVEAHAGRAWLTCDVLGMSGTFAPRHEYDIALAGVGIVVLQKEELVDAVLLQRRDLDDDADRTGQALLDDQVLLPADLWVPRLSVCRLTGPPGPGSHWAREAGTYTLKEIQKVLPGLVSDMLGVEPHMRSHRELSWGFAAAGEVVGP